MKQNNSIQLVEHLQRLGEEKHKALLKIISKPTPLFTVAQAAIITNTSEKLWRKLIYLGEVEYYKVRGRIQIPLHEISRQITHYPSIHLK